MCGDCVCDVVRPLAREHVAVVIQLEQLGVRQQPCEIATDGRWADGIAGGPDQQGWDRETAQVCFAASRCPCRADPRHVVGHR